MRLRLLLAVLLLGAASPLLAQASADSSAAPQAQAQPAFPAKPPLATGRITGTVFCNDTHSPARGAMVMAEIIPKSGPPETRLGTASARVAMDGTYTLSHLRPGDYTVVALLPGYLSPYEDPSLDQFPDRASDSSADAALRAALTRNGVVSVRNDETARLDVTLERGASISGRVLYSDGSPATQVLIYIEDVHAKPTQHTNNDLGNPRVNAGTLIRSFFMHQSQGTDDQGNYRIAGLKPGTYRVSATQPSGTRFGGTPHDGIFSGIIADPNSLHIYSGDTFHKNSAKTYQLRAGDDVTGVDITIPIEAFHSVQGHLATLDGTPVSVASLTLTDTADDSFVLRTQPERDGSFTFPTVPSGTYKLSATDAKIGTPPPYYPDDMPLQAGVLEDIHILVDASTTVLVKDSDLTDIDLQLTQAGSPGSASEPTPSASQ